MSERLEISQSEYRKSVIPTADQEVDLTTGEMDPRSGKGWRPIGYQVNDTRKVSNSDAYSSVLSLFVSVSIYITSLYSHQYFVSSSGRLEIEIWLWAQLFRFIRPNRLSSPLVRRSVRDTSSVYHSTCVNWPKPNRQQWSQPDRTRRNRSYKLTEIDRWISRNLRSSLRDHLVDPERTWTATVLVVRKPRLQGSKWYWGSVKQPTVSDHVTDRYSLTVSFISILALNTREANQDPVGIW